MCKSEGKWETLIGTAEGRGKKSLFDVSAWGLARNDIFVCFDNQNKSIVRSVTGKKESVHPWGFFGGLLVIITYSSNPKGENSKKKSTSPRKEIYVHVQNDHLHLLWCLGPGRIKAEMFVLYLTRLTFTQWSDYRPDWESAVCAWRSDIEFDRVGISM